MRARHGVRWAFNAPARVDAFADVAGKGKRRTHGVGGRVVAPSRVRRFGTDHVALCVSVI
jgi:hypothetical protein